MSHLRGCYQDHTSLLQMPSDHLSLILIIKNSITTTISVATILPTTLPNDHMTPWPIISTHAPPGALAIPLTCLPYPHPLWLPKGSLRQHLAIPPASPSRTNTTTSRWLQNVGSKLKWSSASSSDQCRSKNERSSTSGKTMMEEVVEGGWI